ncbi:two-component response regulator 24 [Jatropha curcas]|uniref:two-component response regulator 24 n=1 Tax=Jatropha curcas TaxID=180498 RepID=UPI001894DC87|nr:two-component response regulator 24 [Jatropha curcas]
MHRAGLRHILFFVIPVPQVLSLQSRLQEQVGENTGARIHEILEQLVITANCKIPEFRASRLFQILTQIVWVMVLFSNPQAVNGKEAVDLHCLGLSYNLIVMNMEMPVMHGYEATKELRDMGVYSAIVGVVSRNEEAENFMEAGLDGCVSKPLSIEKLAPFLPFPSTASTGESDDDYDGDDRQSSTSSNGN